MMLNGDTLKGVQREYYESLLRLNLLRFSSEKEFIEHVLEEIVRLTASAAGYFHFVKADQINLELFCWSRDVLKNCTAGAERHYSLKDAGIWADSARQKRAVIHNVYPEAENRQGMPEGHFPVHRHMSVPVLDKGNVVLIAGVGNKADPYTETDAHLMEIYLDNAWKTILHLRSEERLSQSQKNFRDIVEAHPDAIFIRDQDGLIRFLNTQAEHLLGMARAGVLDKPFPATLPTATAHEDFPLSVPGRKQPVTVEMRATPIQWQDKPATLLFFRDITRQKELNLQVQHYQKVEAVGQLAGGIAHDFNNLLNIVIGNAELLKDTLPDDSEAGKQMNEILGAAERGAGLVRQLLAFCRKQILQLAPIDLNEKVKASMPLIQRLIPENIRVEFTPGHGCGTILADPAQIDQILLNLCINAKDSMPHGGQILLTSANVVFDEEFVQAHSWAKVGRYTLLSVTDTGGGIAEEKRPYVFEPVFSSQAPALKTGLGLATVHGIVTQHQGLIRFETEIGKGTTFLVYFPFAPTIPQEARSRKASPFPGGSETILLAEDDGSLRQLGKTFLELGGYTVLAARDGEEALAMLQAHSATIRLAILDVIMPGKGGKEVMEVIKKTYPLIRVLFTSGYTANAIHADFVLPDGLNLLMKPYCRGALLGKVREILDA